MKPEEENSTVEQNAQLVTHQEQTVNKSPQVGLMELNVTDDLLAKAGEMVKSGLLPDSIQTAAAAVVIMQYGRELGFPPMASFKNIFVVNGTPSLASKATSGLLYKGGVRWKVVRDNEPISNEQGQVVDTITTIVMVRDGIEHTMSFYWSTAVRAGLAKKDVWKKYPQNMMYWRCLSMIADRVAPDLLMGMPDVAVMGDVHNVKYELSNDGDVKLT